MGYKTETQLRQELAEIWQMYCATRDGSKAAIEAAVAAERERWNTLRNKLQADITRPEGRWGMHGREAVGDDYFAALEWMLERMDEILGPNARLTAPDTAQRTDDE